MFQVSPVAHKLSEHEKSIVFGTDTWMGGLASDYVFSRDSARLIGLSLSKIDCGLAEGLKGILMVLKLEYGGINSHIF